MTALQAGITAFRQESLIPLESMGWDEYQARQHRYMLGELYYSNVAYTNLTSTAAMAAKLKIDNKLYKRIRGIYNPVGRLVEGYVSKVYNGSIDYTFERGAIPLLDASDAEKAAIKRILRYSNWGLNKDVYVRQGAKLGDAFIKVVDDSQQGRVRLELLDPAKVKQADFDPNGRVLKIIIEYEKYEDDPRAYTPEALPQERLRHYTYTEIIQVEGDNVVFQTLKDARPFAYFEDGFGQPVDTWSEPYPFIPIVHVMHKNEGRDWGAAPYWSSVPKINEVNDQASLLSDVARRNIDTVHVFFGVNRPKDGINISSDDKDDLKFLFVPTTNAADVKYQRLDSDSSVMDAMLTHIERLQQELEADMPELAMKRLRDVTNPTAPATMVQYNDAIDRFEAAQAQYDHGLQEALRMAMAIGGVKDYDDMAGFAPEYYLDNDAEWSIKARPIIENQLTTQEKITFLMGSSAPSKWVWRELGISEDEIAEAEAEAEERRQQMQVQFGIDDNPRGNPPENTDTSDDQPDKNTN